MLEQVKEFNAWGLSKLAVRNIVVFFICTLIGGIGFLSKALAVKDSELKIKEDRLIECKELATEAVEKFKNEQIYQMSVFFNRQDSLSRKISELSRQIKKKR